MDKKEQHIFDNIRLITLHTFHWNMKRHKTEGAISFSSTWYFVFHLSFKIVFLCFFVTFLSNWYFMLKLCCFVYPGYVFCITFPSNWYFIVHWYCIVYPGCVSLLFSLIGILWLTGLPIDIQYCIYSAIKFAKTNVI